VSVMITGGSGFIGVNLALHLLREKIDVVLLDLRPPHKCVRKALENHHGYSYVQGNVFAAGPWQPIMRDVDAIVHLAAMSGVEQCKNSPLESFDVNVQGTMRMLEAAQGKRFIFASSGAVMAKPLGIYGAQKAGAEKLCEAYEALVLRFTNVYGPWSWHKTSAVHAFIRAVLAGENLLVHGDGEQKRDFIYVSDVCRAIVVGLESNFSGVETIGTNKYTSVMELARLIMEEARVDVPIVKAGDGGPSCSEGIYDSSEFGWKSAIPLKVGISKTVDWYRRHG